MLGKQQEVTEVILQKASSMTDRFICVLYWNLQNEVEYHTIRKFEKQLDSIREGLLQGSKNQPVTIGWMLV